MWQTPVRERRAVAVRGIVQGVGFRPFIYSLAHRYGLVGWVRNDADGVHIEAEGPPEALECFLRAHLFAAALVFAVFVPLYFLNYQRVVRKMWEPERRELLTLLASLGDETTSEVSGE